MFPFDSTVHDCCFHQPISIPADLELLVTWHLASGDWLLATELSAHELPRNKVYFNCFINCLLDLSGQHIEFYFLLFTKHLKKWPHFNIFFHVFCISSLCLLIQKQIIVCLQSLCSRVCMKIAICMRVELRIGVFLSSQHKSVTTEPLGKTHNQRIVIHL